MIIALWLLATQGVIGAFDTLYYHEWRARLPALGKQAAPELKLHAARDFFYAVLFATLPWIGWHGAWVLVLVGVFVAEIALTLTDFIVEIKVRKPLGDVYAGERVTHAVMGILYGAMIANLFPTLVSWWSLPTALVAEESGIPELLRLSLLIMAAGVFLSGLRDLHAALGRADPIEQLKSWLTGAAGTAQRPCPICSSPLTMLADLPSANGFEFELYGCPRCEHRQMHCYCVASSTGGTESVTPEDAATMMTTDPRDLKPFMKAWQERVIGN